VPHDNTTVWPIKPWFPGFASFVVPGGACCGGAAGSVAASRLGL